METIEWETSEYKYVRKRADWYWALGIITVSLSAASFILDNFLFAVLILIGGFLLALYGAKHPDELACTLDNTGLQINSTLYPYASLRSFWVDRLSEPPKLIIQSKKSFMPYIVTPLDDLDPDMVREFLLRVLPEEEHFEPAIDRMMERLGL